MALICLAFAACSVVWSLANAFGTASHGTFGAERSAADAARAQQEHAAAVRKAKTELAALPSARPPVAVQAAIGAILADPRSDNCEDLNGPYTRKHCPDLVPLRKELGVAKARQSLSSRLAELRKVDAQHRSVSEVEPYIEGAVRLGRQLGIEVEPDNVRLVRLALFVVLLEFGKVFGVGFVAWLTSRPPSAAALPDPGPSGAIPAPPEPGPKKACPEPASWLLEAFHGGGDLPTGIERRNGGLQGSYAAFAAAWGTSTAKAQRLGRQWQESGEFTVRTGRRGTWIGPLPRRLHAV